MQVILKKKYKKKNENKSQKINSFDTCLDMLPCVFNLLILPPHKQFEFLLSKLNDLSNLQYAKY